jgi:hypothetical protein
MVAWRYSSSILDLGTRWRLAVSFTAPAALLFGKKPEVPIGLESGVDPRAGLEVVEKNMPEVTEERHETRN